MKNYESIIIIELKDFKNQLELERSVLKTLNKWNNNGVNCGIRLTLDVHNHYSTTQIVSLLSELRANFKEYFKKIPTTIYYDYTETDEIFTQLLGASGYIYGLSNRFDTCSFYDQLLEMPTIEICKSDDFEGVIF